MSKQVEKRNRERFRGKLRVAKGRITGNRNEVWKGKLQQKRGTVRKKIGHLKKRLF